MKAVKGEEIVLVTTNRIGVLFDVSAALAGAGINIRALNAYSAAVSAQVRVVTSDTARTKDVLRSLGEVMSREAVIVEVADQIGQLKILTERLKGAGIDITHIYGTASQPQVSAIIVFSSNDNDKALSILLSEA
ncbi:MAG: ACT domain-containing protein [Candidatus Omnitrophota bacterium]|nr:hypothetical protein [Candidatus Omnitrophota bacterium]